MFEKIYSDVSNELLRNNVTDINVAVRVYRNKIVDMVANYFPTYEHNLGGPQQIIEVIARQAGNKTEMERYLDENVPKWRNYLNDNQFLNAIAVSMTERYFNEYNKNTSILNDYNINDAVLDTINRNVNDFGLRINSEEWIYNNLLEKIKKANLNDKQKSYLTERLNAGYYNDLIDWNIVSSDEMEDMLNKSKKGPTM